jgi:outer membrane protein assembly factor BamB
MRKKLLLIGMAVLGTLLLSGCLGSTAWPGLSATDEVAYLANTTAVHAVNIKTGEELWSYKGTGGGFLNTNPSLFVTTPVLTEDGLLIILDSGNKHVMYAVDTRDVNTTDKTVGLEWTFSEAKGHWIAPPLVVGDRLFAPNSDGKVYVLDLTDGRSEKKAIRVINPYENLSGPPGRLWAQPVSDGERLFITSIDHSIFAIDLETYAILWHEDLGGAVPAAPALGSDGMLYVGSLGKQLERIDPATGRHEVVLETNGWLWGTPLLDGDNLYFSDVDGYFYSYNVTLGALNWEPILLDGAITGSPLVLGGEILVVAESGEIFAISPDGDWKLWHRPAGEGKSYTTPVLAGDYVLAAYLESDYYLVALDHGGNVKWTFPKK